jgi:hypothetical protein
MSYLEPAARLERLEQQLAAFERLHGDELRELQRRLEAYQRLQEDEARLLREEIADLRATLGEAAARPASADVTTPPPRPTAADATDPQMVEPIIETAVENALEQEISRRDLFRPGHGE